MNTLQIILVAGIDVIAIFFYKYKKRQSDLCITESITKIFMSRTKAVGILFASIFFSPIEKKKTKQQKKLFISCK